MARRAAGRNSDNHYIRAVVFGEGGRQQSHSWSLLGQSDTTEHPRDDKILLSGSKLIGEFPRCCPRAAECKRRAKEDQERVGAHGMSQKRIRSVEQTAWR